jgi:pimeloyl-ACP methyl ester carboxylesterase
MNLAQSALSVAQAVPFARRSGGTQAPASLGGGDPGERPRRRRDMPVLFFHGWGVGPASYGAPLAGLRDLGCEVMAPALPAFGGVPALPGDECSFPGYGRWAASYLDAVGVDEPVTVVGHSFGGGVAVQLAHDHPDRVAALVLCNGVGGFPWTGPASPQAISERPWWEWGRILGADLFGGPTNMRILPALLGEAVPNLVSNPLAMWRVGEFVRRAHLLDEVGTLRQGGLPISIVWSDRLVPHAGFVALCRAAGVAGEVVHGGHSWLIAEPRRFVDIVWRAMVESGVVEATMTPTG